MIRKCYSSQKFVIEVYKDNALVGYYSGKDQQGNICYGDLQKAVIDTENHNTRLCDYLRINYGEELQFRSKGIIIHHTYYFYHEDEVFDCVNIKVLWVIRMKDNFGSESLFIKGISPKPVFVNKTRKWKIFLKAFDTTSEIVEAYNFKKYKIICESICKQLSGKCDNQYEFYPERFYVRDEKIIELMNC